MIRPILCVVACAAVVSRVNAQTVTLSYDFTAGAQGWQGIFADLPANYDPFLYNLHWEYDASPLGSGFVLNIAGQNSSDDLFMGFVRRIDGLAPSTDFALGATIEYLYNSPMDAVGIGGSPGAGVFMKVGGLDTAPIIAPDLNNSLRFANFDKGNQATSGQDARMIGPIGTPAGSGSAWLAQTRSLASGVNPLVIRSDPNGSVWIVFGTDSGFEGINRVAYTGASFLLTTVRCTPDLNGDGALDNGDIGMFVVLFLAGDLAADFNADGLLDNGDIIAFVIAFLAGC